MQMTRESWTFILIRCIKWVFSFFYHKLLIFYFEKYPSFFSTNEFDSKNRLKSSTHGKWERFREFYHPWQLIAQNIYANKLCDAQKRVFGHTLHYRISFWFHLKAFLHLFLTFARNLFKAIKLIFLKNYVRTFKKGLKRP